jgi:pyruvate, water dikinase
MIDPLLSTGLPGLDRVLRGIMPGDNFVWQVESLADFAPFATAFCQSARARRNKLIYFRFADHEPLVPDGLGAEVHRLRGDEEFEPFVAQVHRVIQEAGPDASLVFDCLSNLVDIWSTDRMLGNFFMLICPNVLDCRSLAYFPLIRNRHSFHALDPIAATTQILIDVFRHREQFYLHPTKVEHRFSPTMHMLHHWSGEHFLPIMDSATTAEVLTSRSWAGLESVRLRPGKWTRTFLQAEETAEKTRRGQLPPGAADRLLPELFSMIVSREERLRPLVERYFTLADVVEIWKRMIGSGLIGGKSVGMLLARAILRHADGRWRSLLEAHDSFFIGSNVFCSFLVENGCWWLRQRQHDPSRFLDDIDEVQRRILAGKFPEYLVDEFSEMLDYFGQSPIIVRSSSLLEDNYGNAFSGKYESVFCANQGPREKRLQDFLAAVKTVYASTMSEKALRYRAQRGLLGRNEQMSLLVQRVSGASYGNLFFPQIAGVALSRNPYVWSESIDPAAGMVRLVFGLGTRAVDRSDDDYTRIVALNAPDRRPECDLDRVRQFCQRRVDVIDLEANHLVSREFSEVAAVGDRLPLQIFASAGGAPGESWGEPPRAASWALMFDELLQQTPFVADMRQMLATLQKAYDYPVDVEFTANFADPSRYTINLVQCRPLQVATEGGAVEVPQDIPHDDCLLEARGALIGPSRVHPIDRLVYVAPAAYGQLPLRDRYSVARLIGRLLHLDQPRPDGHVMLIGPGRWGTTTPSLGVPVAFAEIDTVAVLCEIVAMREDLVPDVSLGTHFFNDLVEMDILYLALFPGRKGNSWNYAFFEQSPNRLAELLPGEAKWADVVRVIDVPGSDKSLAGATLKLHANAMTQQVVCYVERPGVT